MIPVRHTHPAVAAVKNTRGEREGAADAYDVIQGGGTHWQWCALAGTLRLQAKHLRVHCRPANNNNNNNNTQ